MQSTVMQESAEAICCFSRESADAVCYFTQDRAAFFPIFACFDLVTSSPQSPGKLLARVAKRREVQFCAQFLCVS